MALTAQQLEIIPAERDLGIVHGCRIYLDDVMHDVPRLVDSAFQTVLTQPADRLRVSVAAVLPAFGTVESFCEILCHDIHQRKRADAVPLFCSVVIQYVLERTQASPGIAPGMNF